MESGHSRAKRTTTVITLTTTQRVVTEHSPVVAHVIRPDFGETRLGALQRRPGTGDARSDLNRLHVTIAAGMPFSIVV